MIDTTKPTAPIAALTGSYEARHTAQQDNAQHKADAQQPQSDVKLSALTKQIATDSSRDVDHARVAEMRAALAAGELPLKPEKIAQAMVQDIFQF